MAEPETTALLSPPRAGISMSCSTIAPYFCFLLSFIFVAQVLMTFGFDLTPPYESSFLSGYPVSLLAFNYHTRSCFRRFQNQRIIDESLAGYSAHLRADEGIVVTPDYAWLADNWPLYAVRIPAQITDDFLDCSERVHGVEWEMGKTPSQADTTFLCCYVNSSSLQRSHMNRISLELLSGSPCVAPQHRHSANTVLCRHYYYMGDGWGLVTRLCIAAVVAVAMPFCLQVLWGFWDQRKMDEQRMEEEMVSSKRFNRIRLQTPRLLARYGIIITVRDPERTDAAITLPNPVSFSRCQCVFTTAIVLEVGVCFGCALIFVFQEIPAQSSSPNWLWHSSLANIPFLIIAGLGLTTVLLLKLHLWRPDVTLSDFLDAIIEEVPDETLAQKREAAKGAAAKFVEWVFEHESLMDVLVTVYVSSSILMCVWWCFEAETHSQVPSQVVLAQFTICMLGILRYCLFRGKLQCVILVAISSFLTSLVL